MIAGLLALAATISRSVASCSAVQGLCTPPINPFRLSPRLTSPNICRFLARQKRVCKADRAHFDPKRGADIDTVAVRGGEPRRTQLYLDGSFAADQDEPIRLLVCAYQPMALAGAQRGGSHACVHGAKR